MGGHAEHSRANKLFFENFCVCIVSGVQKGTTFLSFMASHAINAVLTNLLISIHACLPAALRCSLVPSFIN